MQLSMAPNQFLCRQKSSARLVPMGSEPGLARNLFASLCCPKRRSCIRNKCSESELRATCEECFASACCPLWPLPHSSVTSSPGAIKASGELGKSSVQTSWETSVGTEQE